ncbi:amino acid ABC transporter substrate-binding protein [Fusobacterium varium]|uniref:amino acid ABC transporter substrate-binding protein n=1 Tax=Fusobacterium varium TaxID=856 RepID=UPI00241CE89B|nr:amino acid ABC transporter substrate-binding protein [Fusobacterium varium]
MKKLFMTVLVIMVSASISLFAADNSLEKVKKDGYFTVGLDATFAPMGFRDENEEIVGFDIDLAKEVAKRMGVEVKFKPCEWDGIIFDLRSKNIDMVWNGMTITEERSKQAAFSTPYLVDGQIIFSRKGNEINKVSELEGKVVGVQLGSSGAQAVERNAIAPKLKGIKKYATNVEALLDLEAGRTDAVVMDAISGKYYNAKKNTLSFSEESLSDEYFAIALRKDDKALLDEINRLLDEMKKDGTFDQISLKWLGTTK